MSGSTPSPPTVNRRRFTRSGSLIAGVATLTAVWLGLSAPGVSPVAPTPAAEATVGTSSQSTGNQSTGSQNGSTDVPVDLVHHRHGHR